MVPVPGSAYGLKTMTEQQPFELVQRYPGFELRRYPAHVLAEVVVRATFDRAGNAAFRPLFHYISGNNAPRKALAMTAPVVQGVGPSQKLVMTAPVLQSGPLPGGDDAAEFVVAFVLPAGLAAIGLPRFARFDPPFKPWFLRHNEVIQDVEQPTDAPGTAG